MCPKVIPYGKISLYYYVSGPLMCGDFTDHSHPAVASSLQILSRKNRTHTFFSSINWSEGTPPEAIYMGWGKNAEGAGSGTTGVGVTCSFSLAVASSQSNREWTASVLIQLYGLVNQITSVHDRWFDYSRSHLMSHGQVFHPTR